MNARTTAANTIYHTTAIPLMEQYAKKAPSVSTSETIIARAFVGSLSQVTFLSTCTTMFVSTTSTPMMLMMTDQFSTLSIFFSSCYPAPSSGGVEFPLSGHELFLLRFSNSTSASILLFSSDKDVIGIDEAQFFDEGLINVCNQLADSGVRVIVAGLDMDFKRIPFGPIPALCAIADEVTKVHAICIKCGNLAYASHRITKSDKRVLLGEKADYEPLCRECYRKAIEEEQTIQ